MTTRHLIDPELLGLIDAQPCGPIAAADLPELRSTGAERQAALPKPTIDPERRYAPGHDGVPDVPLLIYRPTGTQAPSPAVLHLHGGGMISGSPELSAYGSAAVALELGIIVASVGYRLAPETPFPGPHEDCYAALAWLADNAEALGIDPDRIAVSGDSAGGGLAAGLALVTRDRGRYRLAAQFLTYPMLDHRTGGAGDPGTNPLTGEFGWTRERNRFGWTSLRGDRALDEACIGWFSPACASDLAGLPPTWIGVGALDLFHDECAAFAHRLRGAGVPVRLEVYPGAPHAFNAAPDARITQRYRNDLAVAFTDFANRGQA